MHKNLVICLCVGDLYSDEYIHKLRNMVNRNTTQAYDFKCYSDRQIPDIDTILITDPDRYEPLFYKLDMLGLPEIERYGRKVFFDLDVVIHNNIDWVFAIPDPALHVLKAEWKNSIETTGGVNTGCNSSVMVWQDASAIYQAFMQSPDRHMMKYSGIDRFLWNEIPHLKFIPAGQVYSYREGASLHDRVPCMMREDMSVCIYHALPKPADCTNDEPAKSHWR